MLPSYDAKAIAEVLGIAFARRTTRSSNPPKTSPTRKTRLSGTVLRNFVDDPLAIAVLPYILPVGEWEADASVVLPASGTAERSPETERRLAPASSASIEKAVENGLPRSALRHVATRLAGGDQTKVSALEWGVVPKTTLERRDIKLSTQESERTERIARLFVHARRALGTEAEAREFMTAAHPELDGRSPFEAARTDLGTRRVERLLVALEYGLAL